MMRFPAERILIKNINPDSNTIDESEIWSWELSERE